MMNITSEVIDTLIRIHDSDMALVYVYYCKTGETDIESVSKGILMPRKKTAEALEKLAMCGLIQSGSQEEQEKPEITDTSKMPTKEDVTQTEMYDIVFASLVREAELVMQRQASVPELQKLLEIYQYYGIAPETLMLLFHVVGDRYEERYAGTRKPSMYAFEKETKLWKSNGVSDLDSAEKYIAELSRKKELETQIRDSIRIVGRDLTETERQYIWAWIDQGFSPDLITAAYDKAVTAKRTYNPAYVNGILKNWKAKGILTTSDLAQKEPSKTAAKRHPYISPPIDPEKLKEIIDTMI